MKTSKKGFTLIELLVAMTIVAVLMGLALISYQGARKIARDGKRKTDLEQIRGALEMYRADEGEYPGGLSDLGGYITVPQDPATGDAYPYDSDTASTYELCADLEINGPDTCTPTVGTGDYVVRNP